ncbi:MAG: mechanosensitive ion channel domain-containing protein [Bacteroidota bacterium]
MPSLPHDLLDQLTAWLQVFQAEGPRNLLTTVVIVVGLWVLRRLVMRVVRRHTTSVDTRHLWNQLTRYGLALVALVLISNQWFDGLRSAFTVLTLVAAALTIIHKETLTSLTAWPFITWRSLFGIGDRIQVGGQSGDVLDLGLFFITLAETGQEAHADQPTGRLIKIPNQKIFNEPVINYGRGAALIWNEVTVPLSATTNRQQAEAMVREAAEAQVAALGLDPGPSETEAALRRTEANPSVYLRVVDERLQLIVRYRCLAEGRLASEHALWHDVLTRFDEAGVVVSLKS